MVFGKVAEKDDQLQIYQNRATLKKLRECNRTAAIVLDTIAFGMETNLRQSHAKDKVYVGKESLFQSGVYFTFASKEHIATPSQMILNRFASYKQAGFFLRWKRIVDLLGRVRKRNRNTRSNDTSFSLVNKNQASLSGNISVIFVVIAIGFAISMMEFVVESYIINWILNPRLMSWMIKQLWKRSCFIFRF